ncbi:Phosphoenolpyruvate carboxykinase [Planctomyces bekefii]|uniref:Phosphoenolpyruvate carboxykinase n=1 Tax=Planctomyces bekefii TaxID=1653850 RepID=A0A5C6M737_9PLAN|nr:Phosphoenolpyruvate carboxykinase [Planctomyces bekefii]
MWKYRDYVIRSFNADKPFDRFVLEQLAGDELVAGVPQSEAERDALLATGYLRLGQWDSTAAIFQEEARLQAELQADLTNTTAAAFLGLTMSCCQCHDHKYDPLTQADHYRMRAFFCVAGAD